MRKFPSPLISTQSTRFIINLVSKSKIPAFISLILSIFQIIQFLLLRQRIPFPVSRFVAPDVIQLNPKINKKIYNINNDENKVAFFMSWSVAYGFIIWVSICSAWLMNGLLTCLIDIGSNYTWCLAKHVIHSRGNSAGPDGIGISGVPPDLDSMSYLRVSLILD
jgi:hypothetical protein